MVRMISAAAGLMVAGSALAGVGNWGLEWRLVDNSDANPVADAAGAPVWNTQAAWTTYDLYLTGDANATFNAVNFGENSNPAATPYFLFTDSAAVFNHPLGGDVRSTAIEGFFNLVRYDTFVALGSLEAASQVGTVDFSLNPSSESVNGVDGLVIRGAWFENPPASAVLSANGDARLLRITVAGTPNNGEGDGFNFLGGNGSQMQLGLDSGLVSIDIPNAVPTPGAFALMGLGGLVAARRRR